MTFNTVALFFLNWVFFFFFFEWTIQHVMIDLGGVSCLFFFFFPAVMLLHYYPDPEAFNTLAVWRYSNTWHRNQMFILLLSLT